MDDRAKNVWWYCGCGCAVLAVLLVGVIAAIGFSGARAFKDFADTMKDPVAREARVLEILGAERLPEGLHAQVYLRIPYVVELVILTDGPVLTEDEEDRAFREADQVVMVLRSRSLEGSKESLDRYLEGQSKKPAFFDNVDVDFDFRPDQVVGRGRLDVGDQTVHWIAHSGELERDGDRAPGVMALAGIDCPNDEKLRVVTWFVRSPNTESADEAPGDATPGDATPAGADAPAAAAPGSPADEVALSYLLGHFDLCSG